MEKAVNSWFLGEFDSFAMVTDTGEAICVPCVVHVSQMITLSFHYDGIIRFIDGTRSREKRTVYNTFKICLN